MSFGKIKRNVADKWFSDCVRMRSNWHLPQAPKTPPSTCIFGVFRDDPMPPWEWRRR